MVLKIIYLIFLFFLLMPICIYNFFVTSIFFSDSSRRSQSIFCFKERQLYTKPTKNHKQSKVFLEEKDYAHIIWWKEVSVNSVLISLPHKLIRKTFCSMSSCRPLLLLFANLNGTCFVFQRMQLCKKPSSVLLVKRLTFSNLLGVDDSLKNGR